MLFHGLDFGLLISKCVYSPRFPSVLVMLWIFGFHVYFLGSLPNANFPNLHTTYSFLYKTCIFKLSIYLVPFCFSYIQAILHYCYKQIKNGFCKSFISLLYVYGKL